jgi:Ca2+-binding EF-hand superfamily protein
MSSIGSVGASSMQRPDPLGIFKKTDSDSSGGVSQAELKNLAGVIKEKTGKTLDVSNDSFKTYDSNSDGSLSGDELKSVLDNSGFGPPHGVQGMGPPPLQATDSYKANFSSSGQDSFSELVSNLQALLEKLTGDSGQSGSKGLQGLPPVGKPQGPPPADRSSTSSNSTSVTQIFDPMDSNKDGTVSASELVAALANKSDSVKSSSTNTSASLQDQINELNNLLKTLSKYLDSKSTESGSFVSITS